MSKKATEKLFLFSNKKTAVIGFLAKVVIFTAVSIIVFFVTIEIFYDKDYEEIRSRTKAIRDQNIYMSKKIKNLKPNFRTFLSDNLVGIYGRLLYSNNITYINLKDEQLINTLSVSELVKSSDSILAYFDLIANDALTLKGIWFNYPLCLPISASEKYVISRQFSENLVDPFTGENKRHNGIDIVVYGSQDVFLPADGEILSVKNDAFWGKTIRVKHLDRYETYYAHLDSVFVKSGQKLTRGTRIGYSGESGWTTHPHLHYELIKNGVNVDPLLYCFDYLYN